MIFVLKGSLTTTWGRDYEGRKGRQETYAETVTLVQSEEESNKEPQLVVGRARELVTGGDI